MKNKLIKQISISRNDSIRKALNAIDRGAIGIALINNSDHTFYGLVTDGDIRRALLSGKGLNTPVDNISRPSTVTASINTESARLLQMISEKIRCIPILDNNQQVVDLYIHDIRTHLPVMEPLIGTKELINVSECILTGWISSAGKFVKQFEKQFSGYCNVKYAVATSSGTTALHLALLCLEIGQNDEVIVPTLTFIATANAVTYTGAKPVFVDVEPDSWTIDPSKIEQAITRKTKAIIPVHLYGHPANMDRIHEIANKYNLYVIEDAAQAHGALYKNKRVGVIDSTTVGCFSFFGNKIITTGEGGMLLTNRQDLYEKCCILRDHGMTANQRYYHNILGYNYRMTNLQAAIGVAQMDKIDSIIAKKRHIANLYTNQLKHISEITMPKNKSWANNVYWLYSILLDETVSQIKKNDLIQFLKHYNIDTRPIFIPVHQQPIYDSKQRFPIAEHIASSGFSLPSSVNLTDNDINYITAKISEFIIEKKG